MNSIKRRWHLAISVNEKKSPLTFQLSERFAISIIAVFISLVLSVVGLFFVFANKAVDKTKFAQVQNENSLLRNQLSVMNSEIDSISAKLKLMQDWENDMRKEKKLKEISDEIRSMGKGGIPQVDSLFKESDLSLNIKYNHIKSNISNLKSRIDFTYSTHEELKDYLNLSQDFYRNTPSIYPTFGRITSKFGFRRHPITRKRDFHNGLDFGNATGTPIYATADGVVKKVGKLRLFGIYVDIEHSYGYETKYAHLQKYIVRKGDIVKKGQVIGLMGNSGRSSGSHLHYEVWRFGRVVNPYRYLDKKNGDIKVARK